MVTPAATVAGAVSDTGASYGEEEAANATTVLKNALARATPAEDVKQAVARELGSFRGGRYEIRALSQSEAGLPNEALANAGFDAVLDIEVQDLDLIVIGRFPPEAAITLTIRASLNSISHRQDTVPFSWTYRGNPYGYFSLAKADARLLRSSIKKVCTRISTLVVLDLFPAQTSKRN
jgi:hypothetical protein